MTNEELQEENKKLRSALEGLMWAEVGMADPVLEDGETNPFDDARELLDKKSETPEETNDPGTRPEHETQSFHCGLDFTIS